MDRADFAYRQLFASGWEDYELINTGNGQRLERLGKYKFLRPDSECLWAPAGELGPADAVWEKSKDKTGWSFKTKVPDRWQMRLDDIRFWAKITPSGHFGLFPEHSVHWDWMTEKISGLKGAKVLNLFGYTGLASLKLARAGAKVTHVDASRPAVSWARENQRLSGLSNRPIRWIVEDAMTFVKREIKRSNKYDGIVLDPPEFGRGPKGEMWKIEKSLREIVESCERLLSDTPTFLLLSVYATQLSATTLYYLFSDNFKSRGGHIEAGELFNVEMRRNRAVFESLFARWSKPV